MYISRACRPIHCIQLAKNSNLLSNELDGRDFFSMIRLLEKIFSFRIREVIMFLSCKRRIAIFDGVKCKFYV